MRRRTIVIALVVFWALVLLNLPVRTSRRVKDTTRANVAPFQNGMSSLISRVGGIFRALAESRRREERLAGLLKDVAELKLETQRLRLSASECDQLRALLEFKTTRKHEMVICRVIGRGEISGWWQTLRLDRGTEQGIAPDMAVVADGGLIGKTTAVAQGFSDVLLITDPNCRVSCLVPKTGGFGIVSGQGVVPDGAGQLDMQCAARPARLDYVPRDEQIGEGYEVVTSGLGGVYPPGILVGHIQRAGVDPSGLYQQAQILPSVRLDTLRYAFVITRKSEGDAR